MSFADSRAFGRAAQLASGASAQEEIKMIAQQPQGATDGAVALDMFQVPGVVAFRVTIQPSPLGCAWSADACALSNAADPPQPPQREAPAAERPSTHALDELFARGL
jgi:hypothetical protein